MTKLLSQASSTKTIFWEIANTCNLRCRHCYVGKRLHDRPLSDLTQNEIAEIILEYHPDRVILLGGEPLLVSNLPSIVEYFSKYSVHVSITTNGTIHDEHLLVSLIEAGLANIAVSLDGGTSETNDKIRGSGVFNKVLTFLNVCMKLGANNIIGLGHCLNIHNKEDFSNICSIAQHYGINSIVANFVYGSSDFNLGYRPEQKQAYRILDNVAEISSRFPDEVISVPAMPLMVQYLNRKWGSRMIPRLFECRAPHNQLLVTIDGRIVPCGPFADNKIHNSPIVGSLTWPQVMSTPLFKRFEQMKTRSMHEVPNVCRQCYLQEWCCMRCPLTLNSVNSFRNYHDCEYALNAALKDGIQVDYKPSIDINIPVTLVG